MGIRGDAGDRARLEVRLLGDVAVRLDGHELPGFDSPRLQRLLLQLSLDDGGRDRARLAYELWPGSTEPQARTNLRKLLHDLRRFLPDADRFVEIGTRSVRWRADAPVWVDLVAFRTAVERGELGAAARHYGGDLLPACYDDWLLAERDRLRTCAVDVLLRLAERDGAAGDDDAAVAHARRLVALDPLHEPAHRLLMDVHARRGDRAEALRVYHRLVETLERDLGVRPAAATRTSYAALRADGAVDTGHPTSPSGTAALVGRDAELAAARAAWRAAAAGRAGLLLVTGEAGIGKTRLVEELSRGVQAQGGVVATARAYAAAGRPAWGPVVDWLRSDPLRPSLDRLDPAWRGEVSRLLPELHTAGVRVRREADAAPRHHLLDGLSRALLVHGRPLLLVIEDLQWCDPDTVELIGFLLRTAPGAPLLVAATVRLAELDDRRQLTGLRVGLDRAGAVTEIPLERLDSTGTAQLAGRLTGSAADPATARRLWRDTEGNPLFVVEAVRVGLAQTGDRTPLSPTVQAVISARLAQLSPAAREVAEVAAILGRSFTVEVLAAASGVGDEQLAAALDELWQRQILRERATGYDFSHDRVREVARDLTRPARRRRIHGSVADALSAVHAADPGPVSARIAWHYEQAGRIADAVDAYRRAGEHAVHVVALDDAIAAFRRALLLLERLPGGRGRDETELELRIALGVPIVGREGYGSDAAHDLYQRALRICRSLGRHVEPPVLRGLGLASVLACRFDRSSRFGEALLRHPGGGPATATEGHYLLGVSSFWQGDLAMARHHLQEAIDTFPARRTGGHLALFGQDPRAVCLIRLAMTELWSGRPDRGRALAEDALRRAVALGHATTEEYVRMYAAILALERDEPESLAEQLTAGEVLWSRQQLRYFMDLGRLLRGWLDVLDGTPGSIDHLASSVDSWRGQRHTLHLTYGLTLLARARLRDGAVDAGRAAAAEGIAWGAAHDQRYAEAELRRLDGELSALGGEHRRAERSFDTARALARAQGARWLELRVACSQARHSRRTTARDALAAVLATFDEGHDLAVVRAAQAVLSSGP